jgi:polysaccharide export outer membrane protein
MRIAATTNLTTLNWHVQKPGDAFSWPQSLMRLVEVKLHRTGTPDGICWIKRTESGSREYSPERPAKDSFRKHEAHPPISEKRLRRDFAMARLWATGLMILAMQGVAAGRPEQPPRELVTYIQDAKKLGLNEEQIRRNAATAGWDARIVDEALLASNPSHSSEDASKESSGADLPEGYRIGIADVLQISVWREPEASVAAATVRSDGKISLPLVKEVEVVGLSPAETERMLAQRLTRFIHGADVTVIVKEVHSRKVYLVGGVRSVGPIDLKGRTTVLQALTQAGGLTDYAKRKQIYVLRTENGRQEKFPFNYEAVIKGENVQENIVLQPNDTVVIPQ